mmetsp:Transcript_14965/g.31786  ORF Transcript_14965/g.31786 Transcript_14965/m.31786 type:complete len:287 (+) Transcript_14965:425-1285(+)
MSSSLSLMSAYSSPFALARLSLAARRGSRRACCWRSTSLFILANSAEVNTRVEDTSCCKLARSSLESLDRSSCSSFASSPLDFISSSLSSPIKTKSGASPSLLSSSSSTSFIAISSSSSPESTSTHPSFSSSSPSSFSAAAFFEASYATRRSAPATPLAALTSPYRNGLSPARCNPAPTKPLSFPLNSDGYTSRIKFTNPRPAMETLRSLCLAYPAMSRTNASTSQAVLFSLTSSSSAPLVSSSSSPESTDGTLAQIALTALMPTAICSPEHRSVTKLCAIVLSIP